MVLALNTLSSPKIAPRAGCWGVPTMLGTRVPPCSQREKGTWLSWTELTKTGAEPLWSVARQVGDAKSHSKPQVLQLKGKCRGDSNGDGLCFGMGEEPGNSRKCLVSGHPKSLIPSPQIPTCAYQDEQGWRSTPGIGSQEGAPPAPPGSL